MAKTLVELGCYDCALKHLADAVITLEEYLDGNRGHDWLCMAHLDQATMHIRPMHPDTANLIALERLAFKGDRNNIPAAWELLGVVLDLKEYAEAPGKKGSKRA